MVVGIGDSTGYNIVLLLHIIFVIVAFGGLFLAPMLSRVDGAQTSVAAVMVKYVQRVALPALILAGVVGFALISMSGEKYKFDQAWIGPAMLLWLIEIALMLVGIVPAQKKVAAGDASAAKMLPMMTGVSHLILIVVVGLMVFKPGA